MVASGFQENWYFFLPEDGAEVPEYVGETHLKCVLIRN